MFRQRSRIGHDDIWSCNDNEVNVQRAQSKWKIAQNFDE